MRSNECSFVSRWNKERVTCDAEKKTSKLASIMGLIARQAQQHVSCSHEYGMQKDMMTI